MTRWILATLLAISLSANVYAYRCASTGDLVNSTNFPLDKYLIHGPIVGLKQAQILRDLPLEEKTTYYITGKLRLLDDPVGKPYVSVHTYYITKLKTGGGRKLEVIGKQTMVNRDTRWIKFGGDFTTLEGTANGIIVVSVYGQKLQVEILSSSLKMQKLAVDAHWKDEANSRISKIRKGNLKMVFKINNKYDTNKLKFRLNQTKAAFPFGTAVSSYRLTNNAKQNIKYREQLTKLFNWGTPSNELKWMHMEKKEGSPNFEPADQAIAGLEMLNMKARGHSLVWSRSSMIPKWLINKSPADIKQSLRKRWSYVAKRWGNRFAHWDVNNENLHDQWFSEKLNDTDLLSWMFKRFHKLVPHAQLFINDYDVFTSSSYNLACRDQVERLIETGAPISGIGVQSHFWKRSSIASYMKRMSVLSESGIPVWLTEFDIRFGSDEERAVLLDDILRLTYSLPYVQGIVFWGFWDGSIQADAPAFMTGDKFELTKMGEKLEELLLKEWRTHETFGLPSSLSVTKRAFYGQYNLTATYEKSTLWTKNIELEMDTNGVVYIDI